jgi:hypothetical protein
MKSSDGTIAFIILYIPNDTKNGALPEIKFGAGSRKRTRPEDFFSPYDF